MLFFRKKLKKPDPEAEQRLRDQIASEGGLEKKDFPAMVFSAYLVILIPAIIILLLFAGFALLLFAR